MVTRANYWYSKIRYWVLGIAWKRGKVKSKVRKKIKSTIDKLNGSKRIHSNSFALPLLMYLSFILWLWVSCLTILEEEILNDSNIRLSSIQVSFKDTSSLKFYSKKKMDRISLDKRSRFLGIYFKRYDRILL